MLKKYDFCEYVKFDVANSKRHQRLDEILIIFTRTIQEISKVVCKKTMSETGAFITSLCCIKRVHYSKRMLRKRDCVSFVGILNDRFFFFFFFFFFNSFANFSVVVRVRKKSRFRPAVGGVSKQHLLFCENLIFC